MKQVTGALILTLFMFSSVYAQDILINEIMPNNSSTVFDEDNEAPDWIELFNASSTSKNLAGYSLSDDLLDKRKWVFPDYILDPGEYLLLFASAKDRTNIVTHWETIVDMGDQWRYLPITATQNANWKNQGFDDSLWPLGASGIGYGDDDDETIIDPVITVYLRKNINIENISAVQKMFLHVDFDDAFVAYINGEEVARSNIGIVGDAPSFDQGSDNYREAQIYQGGDPELFDLSGFITYLQNGENLLAIEVHNYTINSSDLSIIPFLTLGLSDSLSNPGGVNPILQISETYFHTNFKLKSSGESLLLSNSSGLVEDSLSVVSVAIDYSYGRAGNDVNTWYHFENPTPGTLNDSQGYFGYADTVKVNFQNGFYDSPLEIVLSTTNGEQNIFYTLDGSDPDSTSQKYSVPISIDKTTVMRAGTSQKNLIPSPVLTKTYFVNESKDLPVISVVTDPNNLWDYNDGIYVKGPNAETNLPFFGANFWQDWEKPGHVEFFEDDKSIGFESGCGIKIFGAWSRANAQKSLSLFFRDEYGKNQLNYNIFPDINVSTFQSFILRNSGNDWNSTMMRDGLMQTLVSGLDIDYQAYRPTVVYLNGEYWGIQNIREKVSEHFIASHHPVDPNNIDMLENNRQAVHGDNIQYSQMLDSLQIIDMSTSFAFEFINRKIDVNSYLNYMTTQIYINNTDWPGNNIKYWKPKSVDGKWRWILFDLDFGFGLFDVEAYRHNTLQFALEENGAGWPNPDWSTLLLRTLLKNPQFQNEFINRFADNLNSVFEANKVNEVINSLNLHIAGEIPEHLQLWEHSADRRNDHLNLMHKFAAQRPGYLRGHIMQEFDLSGMGQLKLDAIQGGSIKVNSLQVSEFPWDGYYFNSVSIQLKAVAKPGYKFIQWSGAINSDNPNLNILVNETIDLKAEFIVDDNSANIVINEINYNSADNFNTQDWIEFFNAGNSDVDLSGWIFKDENDAHAFVFPENTIVKKDSFLVLVENDSSFISLFPGVNNYIAEMSFGLSGSGEHVRLYDSNLNMVDSLTYNDNVPWPLSPDGNGATLELLDYTLDNSLAENWRASASHGSPGKVNSVYTAIKEINTPQPKSFSLFQNYPNPFNSETRIKYSVAHGSYVSLKIYNIYGQELKTLVSEFQQIGNYNINFNANEFASGLYFYIISFGGKIKITHKMILLR